MDYWICIWKEITLGVIFKDTLSATEREGHNYRFEKTNLGQRCNIIIGDSYTFYTKSFFFQLVG